MEGQTRTISVSYHLYSDDPSGLQDKLHMYLTRMQRRKEDIRWELVELCAQLLPLANKVSRQISHDMHELQQCLPYNNLWSIIDDHSFISDFQILHKFLLWIGLTSNRAEKLVQGNSFSLAKLTWYKAITIHPMTTWHLYIFLFIIFNAQIKTTRSCFALYDATISCTTQNTIPFSIKEDTKFSYLSLRDVHSSCSWVIVIWRYLIT